jgi:lipoate-protein ligase A
VPLPDLERHPSGLVIRPWTRDESLIAMTRGDGRPRVAVYSYPGTDLVLGRGSSAERELKLEAVLADEVPVFRRRGGGCSVLLDPGNLIVSVALPLPGIGASRRAFGVLSDWIITALAEQGLGAVEQNGISDLTLGNRKIGGSAIYRAKGLLYYSTTLLVDPDLAGMERWLAHPPREPEYREGRKHTAFLRRLSRSPDSDWDGKTLNLGGLDALLEKISNP